MVTITRTLCKWKSLKKDGSHPIMFRLTLDRKSTYISTGYSAFPEQWDKDSLFPNKRYPNQNRLTHFLMKREIEIRDVLLELDTLGDPYSLNDIRIRLGYEGERIKLLKFFEQKIKRLKKTGKEGNARAYSDTRNSVKRYLNDQDIHLEKFNYRKLKGFEEHLEERGLMTNSRAFHLRTLRALLNSAIKEGVMEEKYYPFKNFKIQHEKTQKRALKLEDIRKIEDAMLENEQLEWARKLFLFSYYSMGMSFKDMAYLKVENIYHNRIQYQRSKTGILYNFEIHPKLAALVKEFRKGKTSSEMLLPIIEKKSNDYGEYRNDLRWFNRLLERLGNELDLSLKLTSYVSRHSYATIAKRKGVATGIISQGLGHTTERTTQIYLDSFENEVMDQANAMIFD